VQPCITGQGYFETSCITCLFIKEVKRVLSLKASSSYSHNVKMQRKNGNPIDDGSTYVHIESSADPNYDSEEETGKCD
jgi:hypothetical protein